MKALALTARRPGGGVTRPYDSLALPAAPPPSFAPGVKWKSYIDAGPTWQWVPEFRDLDPHRQRHDRRARRLRPPGRRSFRPALHRLHPDCHRRKLYLLSRLRHRRGFLPARRPSDRRRLQPLRFGVIRRGQPLRRPASRSASTTATPPAPARSSLEWSGPGITRQAVPSSAFFIEGTATPGPPTANDDSATTAIETSVLIDVLANDFDDGTPSPLAIQSVGTPDFGHGGHRVRKNPLHAARRIHRHRHLQLHHHRWRCHRLGHRDRERGDPANPIAARLLPAARQRIRNHPDQRRRDHFRRSGQIRRGAFPRWSERLRRGQLDPRGLRRQPSARFPPGSIRTPDRPTCARPWPSASTAREPSGISTSTT